MTNTYKLDDVRDEARRKFAPVEIEVGDTTVELKPLLRLRSNERKAVLDAFKEIRELDDIEEDEEDDDELADEVAGKVCDAIARVLKLIASSPRKLIAELDREDDPRVRSDMYTTVLKLWAGETQLGEAGSSPS